jgi:hypothetical protein
VKVRWLVAPLVALVLVLAVAPGPAGACGGFFCGPIPVDQAGEQIVFTMDEGTITTYVQINYVGKAEDFAWVLPLPAVPKVETAEMAMFRDLSRLTAPQYLPPAPPDCLRRPMPAMAQPSAGRAAESSTTVLASGEVGPFGYHVVTSPDPEDLVTWLRDNSYHITDEMKPLVRVYTDEGLVFLAMRLKQNQNSSDIVPVKLTYESSIPTIPLRLTAVAATPDMPVTVWTFAKEPVQTLNYVPITIADSEIRFSPFGGNDYRQVVSQAVDQAGGRAFVTEMAQPTSAVRPPSHPEVTYLFSQYPWLTRHFTRISPDEMTADPSFELAPGFAPISNIHDLRNRPAPWNCSDDFNTFKPVAGSGPPPWIMGGGRYLQRFGEGGGNKAGLMFAIVALTALAIFRPSLARSAAGRVSMAWTRSARGVAAFGSSVWGATGLARLSRDAVVLLFLEMVVLQGVHEVEHIVQVFQRTVLGIGKGAGILGSAFDIEPVHMVYNLAFLVLLAGVYAGCRRELSIIPKNADAVMTLLSVSFFFQGFHTVEHVVKMWQYFATGVNGTPGIFGYWIPVVYLHLGYNTALYVPVVIAFFLGGFHLVAGGLVAEMVQGRRRRRTGPRLAS